MSAAWEEVCDLLTPTLSIYYTDSDVFLTDSVDLADISDFFADIWTLFSRWVVKISNGLSFDIFFLKAR